MKLYVSILIFSLVAPFFAFSQADKNKLGELAKEIKDPVSLHYMLPLQNNFEVGDVDNQFRYNLKVEPVLPFLVGEKWKIITRTVAPIIVHEFNGTSGYGSSGLGDISLTGWLAPQKKKHGLVWGLGAAMDLPTATKTTLGAGKWTIGPSALLFKETGAWSFGLLVNQLWSYAGYGPTNVCYAFIDPWIDYTWNNGFGLALESESVFNWETDEQTIPIRFGVSQVFLLGNKQPLSINLDGLYYARRPEYEAKWGISLTLTFVFQHTAYR